MGLDLIHDDDTSRITLRLCIQSTPANRIPRWRSTLRSSLVIAIDGNPVDSISDIQSIVTTARASGTPTITLTLVTPEYVNLHPDTMVP